ncbi:MAG: gluconokinase [Flavitalea sp.]
MVYVIGVDIGTSGTKAIALSGEGEELYSSTVSYSPVDGLEDGWHELDPLVLLNAFISTTADVIQHCESMELAGIGISTAMHGLMCIGKDGQALTNIITWADQRSIKQAEKLLSAGHATEFHRISGTPVHAMSPLCKILWLKENDRVTFAKTSFFIGIKEFILHSITGEFVIDESLASATGLFDIHQQKWSNTILSYAGISESVLPQVEPIDKSLNIHSSMCSKLGLKKSVPIIIGSSDGCLANIGSNCFDEGSLAITIGTSGAARRLVKKENFKYNPFTFAYLLDEQHIVVGGPVNNGGILLKWYAETFLDKTISTATDFEWFLDEAMKAEPGCDGLIFLPYLYGERAPVWDAKAKGAFIGIHSGHKQEDFMRAVIEGICYPLKQVVSSLEHSGGAITKVCASGGFTRSPDWVQTLSNILNKTIVVQQDVDASALGAAIVTLKSIGKIQTYNEIFQDDKVIATYLPDQEVSENYEKYSDVFNILYPLLKQSFHKLHEIGVIRNS